MNRHIAIITPGFASDEQDSTCIPALQLFVKELLKKGMKVTVFSLHYPFRTNKYNWYGAEVIPLNGRNSFIKRKTILYTQLKKAFSRINTDNKISIIHSFWLNESTHFASRLGLNYNIKTIATAQGQDVLNSNSYLNKINWENLEAFCLSEFQKNILEKTISKEINVIPMGIKQGVIQKKEFDIIGVGNLIRLKNFSYFIELCKALINLKPNFSAQIIGVGDEGERLLKLVEEHKLTEHISFLGELSYPKTQIQIAKSKVLIHSSSYEGFGMVLIEALANQTHVLSSPVGVAFEEEKITKLKFDLEEDSKVLLSLLDKDIPDSKLYSLESTIEAYLKIYREID